MRRAAVLALILIVLAVITAYRVTTVIYAGDVLEPMNGKSLASNGSNHLST